MRGQRATVSIVMATALLVVGCATTYQASDFTGGYEHERLAEDQYIVSFRGNGFTSATRSRDFAMLRAAEIGLRLGYTYFVVDTVDDRGRADSTASGPVYKPGVDLHVRYFDGMPDGRHLEIYQVEQLAAEVRDQYGLGQ